MGKKRKKKKGVSLRVQELTRKIQFLFSLLEEEQRKYFELERQYEKLNENFFTVAHMKVEKIAELLIEGRIKKDE